MANKKIKSRFFGKIQQEYFILEPHYVNNVWFGIPEIKLLKNTQERCLLTEIELEHVFEKGDEIFIPDVNKNTTIEKVVLGIDGSRAYYTTFIKEVIHGEKYEQSKIEAEEKLKEELEKYNEWKSKERGVKKLEGKDPFIILRPQGLYDFKTTSMLNLIFNGVQNAWFENRDFLASIETFIQKDYLDKVMTFIKNNGKKERIFHVAYDHYDFSTNSWKHKNYKLTFNSIGQPFSDMPNLLHICFKI